MSSVLPVFWEPCSGAAFRLALEHGSRNLSRFSRFSRRGSCFSGVLRLLPKPAADS
jgi:hypothetical protein